MWTEQNVWPTSVQNSKLGQGYIMNTVKYDNFPEGNNLIEILSILSMIN